MSPIETSKFVKEVVSNTLSDEIVKATNSKRAFKWATIVQILGIATTLVTCFSGLSIIVENHRQSVVAATKAEEEREHLIHAKTTSDNAAAEERGRRLQVIDDHIAAVEKLKGVVEVHGNDLTIIKSDIKDMKKNINEFLIMATKPHDPPRASDSSSTAN